MATVTQQKVEVTLKFRRPNSVDIHRDHEKLKITVDGVDYSDEFVMSISMDAEYVTLTVVTDTPDQIGKRVVA